MSYLEERLKGNVFKETVKESGKEALIPLAKQIAPEFMIPVYTIPKFYHSFNLWASYIEMSVRSMSSDINVYCQKQCMKNTMMLAGKNVQATDIHFQQCSNDCADDWVSPVLSYIHVNPFLMV